MKTYSNPRMTATIENWPHGSQRVTAQFHIETTPRGERAVRTTTGTPKKLTFEDRNGMLELARILREVADKLDRDISSGRCRDVNGNTVGDFVLEINS